jgi:hypothetical protein
VALVDHVADDASSQDRCAGSDDQVRVVVGRALIEALMWTVRFVIGVVLAQYRVRADDRFPT